MHWLYQILAGLLAAPVGFALGTAVAYAWLSWRGVSEAQGRRGLLAGTAGGPLGVIAAFVAGHQTAGWLLDGGGGSWRTVFSGLLVGLPAAAILGTVALVAGVHLAERRGVTNYAGERAAWALYWLALPTAVVTAIIGFLAGGWLLGDKA